MQHYDDILRERGYRHTPQRYMILQVIKEANEHLNIEQITQRVQELNPQVSQGTVYRTLELLQTLELVQSTHLFGQQIRYEAIDRQAHHHFVCRKCHAVLHLDAALLKQVPLHLQERYHVHGLTLRLTVTGYCDTCWSAMPQCQGRCTHGSSNFLVKRT